MDDKKPVVLNKKQAIFIAALIVVMAIVILSIY
mgnify:FL=1|jgi:hypothetical protein